ncbi:MAG: ROK family protein [Anaerolineae bacterium]
MRQGATASTMRKINRSAILDLLRQRGPISRSQIARQLHMSVPTVMRIVDDLMKEDLVRVQGIGESTGGRPGTLLEFNGNAYAVVGVDLGGTKMFGTVADLAGTIQHELYIPHEDNGSCDCLERLCELIETLLDAPRPQGQRIRGIGVGAPGITLTPEGIVTWAPSLGWRDLPLQQILRDRFGLPVFVENDLNLIALGEWGFGAGQGTQNMVSIAVGTGIGAGIIIGGTLYRGHHQAAGEVGYLLPGVEFFGRTYDQFGALESLASGLGVAQRARQLLEQQKRPLPSQELDAHQVFAAARNGEDWAQQVVNETVDYLSLAIASISALLDPEVIVLGGGVARSADLLIDPILQRLEGRIPCIPRLVASSLGRRAAAMGAIMLVLNSTTEYFVVRRLP